MFKIPKVIPENIKFDMKSIHEEVANMVSHGIALLGVLLSVPFLLFRAWHYPNPNAFWACLVFSLSIIMVYSSSTLYHSAYTLALRRKFRVFDHVSIYFLIAGSYTPIIVIFLKSKEASIVLVVLWTMVLIGTLFKIFFTHKFKVASTLAYLVMGWMAVFIYEDIGQHIPKNMLHLIYISGAFYSLGIIFYLWRALKHSHLIWHLFVMAGSFFHFAAIYVGISLADSTSLT